MTDQLRCARCSRFIGEDCLEGWSGGLFGDYNGTYYCAWGKGCNADTESYNGVTGNSDDALPGPVRLAAALSRTEGPDA